MPRRRHRQATTPPARGTGWQWRTFPVFFAFVCGVFVMGLAAGIGGTALGILFLASLAGMGFGLAHIVTRQIALRRTQRFAERNAPPPATGAPPTGAASAPAAPAPPRRRRRH